MDKELDIEANVQQTTNGLQIGQYVHMYTKVQMDSALAKLSSHHNSNTSSWLPGKRCLLAYRIHGLGT